MAEAGSGPAAPRTDRVPLGEIWGLSMPTLRYVVDGLIVAGSLTLFAGREKEGKSLAMLDLAASVAAGEEWAGHATIAGPVLYCPAEDSLRTVRDRLIRRLGVGHTADTRPLEVVPLSGSAVAPGREANRLDLNSPELVGSPRRTVEEVRPALVVLDCLRELHSARENESDDMTVTMWPLRQLAHELDVAVIVVHHASKSQSSSARGSTAIAAVCDATAFWATPQSTRAEAGEGPADPEPGEPLRATLTIRGRDVPKEECRLEMADDLRFHPAVLGRPGAGFHSRVRQQVIAVLSDGLWRTAPELAAATGMLEGTVANLLRSFCAGESARVERSATGHRGNPTRYRLRPVGRTFPHNQANPLGIAGYGESSAGSDPDDPFGPDLPAPASWDEPPPS